MNVETIRKQLQENLCQLSAFAEEFALKKELTIDGITASKLQKETLDKNDFPELYPNTNLNKKSVIYIVDFEGVGQEELTNAFVHAKEKRYKNHRKFCRFEKKEEAVKCLYVGSKKEDFRARFRQHLGYGPKGTYALNLKYWLPKDARLTFHVYTIKSKDCSQIALEFLEQAIWDDQKPLLGKRSGL